MSRSTSARGRSGSQPARTRKRGIAFKLTLYILSSITLIFALIFGYSYVYSRKVILKTVEESARNLAQATTNRIGTILRSMEVATQNLAIFLQQTPPGDKDKLLNLLRSFVEGNPEIYGSTIAFEPYAFDQNSLYFAPYFYKSGGRTRFTYIGGEEYQYFYWTWYQIPKELNRPVWNEPYFDQGAGNIIMSTYSVPLYRNGAGKKELLGILTADISLRWLQEIVSSIQIYRTGYGFLISRNGTFVTHPLGGLVMNETLFSMAEERGDSHLREVGRQMVRGEAGFVPCRSLVTNRKSWLAYGPVPSANWSLGVVYPQDELMADLAGLNRTVILLFGAGFLLLLGVIVWNARSITRPLRQLAGAAGVISTGNLDAALPSIRSRDEVGNLAGSFAHMKDSLKEYIANLAQATAAKERIESELKIAREIQMSIIPKIFPPFPDRPEFDIFAKIEPAREVGGDLYDFFFIDEGHICFMIGDVSGKGVPASLFMAVAKTLFKAKAGPGVGPGEILSRLNDELALDNESCMFVTVFCGILDTRTGEVVYANAGHNPPLVMPRDGEARYLGTFGDLALGLKTGQSFHSARLGLAPGDALFMYTDGVTEAANAAEELFSEPRLRADLSTLRGKPIRDIVLGMIDKIGEFAPGIPQADDITMLILRFYGSDGREPPGRPR
jgi:sigma-B regulation protein RsbU (phosphoserine phosphatase)